MLNGKSRHYGIQHGKGVSGDDQFEFPGLGPLKPRQSYCASDAVRSKTPPIWKCRTEFSHYPPACSRRFSRCLSTTFSRSPVAFSEKTSTPSFITRSGSPHIGLRTFVLSRSSIRTGAPGSRFRLSRICFGTTILPYLKINASIRPFFFGNDNMPNANNQRQQAAFSSPSSDGAARVVLVLIRADYMYGISEEVDLVQAILERYEQLVRYAE